MKLLRTKLKASILLESLIATVIIAIVLSLGLSMIFGPVWTSKTNQREFVLQQFRTIETAMRQGGTDTEEPLEYDTFIIEVNRKNKMDHLEQISLEAKDAQNKLIATYVFLLAIPEKK